MFEKTIVRCALAVALAAATLGGSATRALAETFSPVDFSSQANFTWTGWRAGLPSGIALPGAPTGPVTLGGVPFNITSNADGNQAWSAYNAAGGGDGQQSITVPVGEYGVTDVYTLINTAWGLPGPSCDAWLIFNGSGGATYTLDLIGGTDIRNWLLGGAGAAQTINGTSTVNVYTGPSGIYPSMTGVLDMQHVVLPPDFASQTLTSIQLVDDGATEIQRAVLDGLTVQSIPEPSTLALLGIAAVSLLAYAWRKRGRTA